MSDQSEKKSSLQQFMAQQWLFVVALTAGTTVFLMFIYKQKDEIELVDRLMRENKAEPSVVQFTGFESPRIVGLIGTEIGNELAPESEVARRHHEDALERLRAQLAKSDQLYKTVSSALEDLGKKESANAISMAAARFGIYCKSVDCKAQISATPFPVQSTAVDMPGPRYLDITRALEAFNVHSRKGLKAANTEECRQLVEDWCGDGRVVAYTLFGQFESYRQTAVRYGRPENDLLKAFRSGLDDEHAFTSDMCKKDPVNAPHYEAVIKSIERRTSFYDALFNRDKEAVDDLLREGVQRVLDLAANGNVNERGA